MYRTLRSPTELEATPLIAGLLQARAPRTRSYSGHLLSGLQPSAWVCFLVWPQELTLPQAALCSISHAPACHACRCGHDVYSSHVTCGRVGGHSGSACIIAESSLELLCRSTTCAW